MKKIYLISVVLVTVLSSCSKRFLNPNIYRTKEDIKGIIVDNTDFDLAERSGVHANDLVCKKDSVTIKATNGSTTFLDYKIIKEDENGLTIIRVLPEVLLTRTPDTTLQKVTVEGDTIVEGMSYRTKKTLIKPAALTSTKLELIANWQQDYSFFDISQDSLVNPYSGSNNGYNYYIGIKKDSFKPLSKTLILERFIGTPLIHPFKLRDKVLDRGWDISTDVSLSYNFGYRIKIGKNPFSQNFFTFSIYGLGLGKSDYFKSNGDGTSNYASKADAIAVTYYQGGLMLTIDKINFGAFVGFDGMIDNKNDWAYQGKPWFSFGIGYKLTSD